MRNEVFAGYPTHAPVRGLFRVELPIPFYSLKQAD